MTELGDLPPLHEGDTDVAWPRHEPPATIDHNADYDALWRKRPRRLNFVDFARAVPGLAALFTGRVPDDFTAQVDDGVLEVACLCKPDDLPRCKLLVPTPCRCGRWFVYDGRAVRVARLDAAVQESEGS